MEHADRYETVKKLLGIEDDKDGYALFSLHRAEEITLNYCNIEEIPNGLDHTVESMAVDIYKANYASVDPEGGGGGGEAAGDIASIKLGDTTVTYATSSSSGGVSRATNGLPDDTGIIVSYRPQLNRYRKVVFR